MPPCSPKLAISAVLLTMMVLAIILSSVALASCNFVKPTVFDLGNLFRFAPDSIGLSCFVTNDGETLDTTDVKGEGASMFHAARNFGIVAISLGSVALVVSIIIVCKPSWAVMIWVAVGLLTLCTCLFQGLVFLVFKSDVCSYGCELDTGGECNLAAIVLWFVSAVASLFLATMKDVKG